MESRPASIVLAILALLLVSRRMEAQLMITEFMAANGSTLADEDGDFSDWIEVKNTGPSAVQTLGWYLTDDPGDPLEWAFPDGLIPSGGFVLVFASGKNRSVPGEELHASFRLDAGGEYLALVRSDGTIAQEFAPSYPEQIQDLSYGIAVDGLVTSLVPAGATARWLVPASPADLPAAWTAVAFADADWSTGPTGIGYDSGALEPGAGGPTENVALSRPATQSSTLSSFGPQNAVDGDSGDFTHTAAGQNLPATWEVDLEGTYFIESIVVHNRDSCCASRLRDITVSILDASGALTVWESELLNPENVLGGGQNGVGPERLDIDLVERTGGLVAGGRVRIVRTPDPDRSGSGGGGNSDEPDVLSLGEVEVLAATAPPSYADLIQTDIRDAMAGTNASACIRIPFEYDPAELPAMDSMTLRMQYNDGFVAYLNGVEIARRSAPAVTSWNSSASSERNKLDAFSFTGIDVSAFADRITEGSNVLAVHGLNVSAGDDDFLVVPVLEGRSVEASVARYFATPTPGAENSGDFFGIVEDTKFSVDRGFFETPFEVEITTATEGASIRYTLDGSEPTATHGAVYSGAILVDRTTVLRARAYRPGLEPTDVDTQTYIFVSDVAGQDFQATLDAGFPASWGGTAPDYGMDPDVIGPGGSDRYGGKYASTIEDDLLSIPTMSIAVNVDDLFGGNGIYTNSGNRGVAWERAASAELIFPDGSEGFHVNCGIRIQGGAFRSHGLTRKHSLRLLFKSIYGPAKLDYPIFGDEASDRIDTIVLRANSNDGWQWSGAGDSPLYVRDSFARESVLDMGGVASHEIFVHLYINGIYWGLYNPVERPDDSFSATYFGGEKDDWDAISNGSVSSGSRTAWDSMLDLARQGLADDALYMRIQGKNPDGSGNPAFPVYIDVENLIDYMITNLYIGNTDWPGKNYWVGRARTDSTGFKFYMWDSEWSMGIRSDLDTNQTGVSGGVAEPYGLLRANTEFRQKFGDRVHRHFFRGGAFYVDPSAPGWDPAHPERNRPAARFRRLVDTIDRAVVAESARWGDQHESIPYTRDEHWEPERDELLQNYFPYRSARVLDQFRSAGLYPDVEAPTFSQHGGPIEPGFELLISGTQGVIYYTTDGTDPRLPGGAIHPAALEAGEVGSTVLIEPGADARVLVPGSPDDAPGTLWTELDFDDAAWTEGRTGVGYERSSGYEDLILTDVEGPMYQTNSSVYIRVAFLVAEPGAISFLRLRMKYDDGFIAYLNGVRVAARNDPASPGWNSSATASHADGEALSFETFDVTAFRDLLIPGTNVLAIHGLNSSNTSSDLIFVPQLEASESSGGQGIVLNKTTLVRARALAGGEWSALNEAVFVYSKLRITEIMYHPPGDGAGVGFGENDFEYIELRNIGPDPILLEGVRLEGGVVFDFASGAVPVLGSGEYVVVVENLAAFESRYGAGRNVAGEYRGRLSNGGELLRLVGSLGETIQEFSYLDFWYPETDGGGFSLVIADEFANLDAWNEIEGWAASDVPLGSPGEEESIVGGRQLPGDANQDGHTDVGDAVSMLLSLYRAAGGAPPCDGATIAEGANVALLDFNADATVDASDSIYLLIYLFRGGPPHVLGESCLRFEGCPDGCIRR